jgi:Protein of unknown function (DUF3489)
MTVYVIRGALVTAVAAAPLTLWEDEVLIGSADEIEASGLSRAQLAAIWNALPGHNRISRFQDRKSAARRLWAAFKELPLPSEVAAAPAGPRSGSKQAKVIGLLKRPQGATVAEVMKATGWLPHTVRGMFSGALKKKHGLTLVSAKEQRGRVYRIAGEAAA